MTHQYLHGNAVDQVFADEDALGEILWSLTDNQGTVRDVVDYDAAGDTTSIANHRQFDAFGNITSETDPTVDFRYAYTGRFFDWDTHLQYNRARSYDAAVALWLSEDPIGFAAGDANLGRYVGNASPNYVDPDGMKLRVSDEQQIPFLKKFFGAENIRIENGVIITFTNYEAAAIASYNWLTKHGDWKTENAHRALTKRCKQLRYALVHAIHRKQLFTMSDVYKKCKMTTTTRRIVRSRYTLRYVADPKEYYNWEQETWGGMVDAELGHKLMVIQVQSAAAIAASALALRSLLATRILAKHAVSRLFGAPTSVHRAVRPGEQFFRLASKGEKGVSVFNSTKVLSKDMAAAGFKGTVVTVTKKAIEKCGLVLKKTRGDSKLPKKLQKTIGKSDLGKA